MFVVLREGESEVNGVMDKWLVGVPPEQQGWPGLGWAGRGGAGQSGPFGWD